MQWIDIEKAQLRLDSLAHSLLERKKKIRLQLKPRSVLLIGKSESKH